MWEARYLITSHICCQSSLYMITPADKNSSGMKTRMSRKNERHKDQDKILFGKNRKQILQHLSVTPLLIMSIPPKTCFMNRQRRWRCKAYYAVCAKQEKKETHAWRRSACTANAIMSWGELRHCSTDSTPMIMTYMQRIFCWSIIFHIYLIEQCIEYIFIFFISSPIKVMHLKYIPSIIYIYIHTNTHTHIFIVCMTQY